jgi:nucleotide-binding universal stress UspA family protein
VTAGAGPVILVPLDGSELAKGALWVAARVAHELRGVLRLVAVHVPKEDAGGAETPQSDLRRYLATTADEVGTAHGTRCEAAVLHGWPPEAIANDLAAVGGSLVIMTAHGRTGMSPSWIGSTTEGVLARSSVPVLVLRPGTPAMRARFERILVALDRSSGSARVLRQALLLGSPGGATTYALIRVVEPHAPAPGRRDGIAEPDAPEELERRREQAAKSLERAAVRLRKHGMVVTTHVVVSRNVAERLIELGRTLHSDAIVVGTQSPHETARLPLGKVADKVLRAAVQPVLVVPVARERAGPGTRRPSRRSRARKQHPV